MPARVTRTSILSGITRTLELKQYEQIEFDKRIHHYNNGSLTLDEAFEAISASAREFIRNGITDDEWTQYMSGRSGVDDRGY